MEKMEVVKTIVGDNDVSFRYVLYEKETFYQTEKVIERGFWTFSFSLCKQTAEVNIKC